MDTLIDIRNLSRSFGEGETLVRALREVNLTIGHGEFVAIMGHSGSGKSTLLNILGCLDRPTSGEYYLDGIPVATQSDNQLSEVRNQKIGFVFQSFNLIPRITALRNVELPMIYRKIPTVEREKRAKELLEQVGLGGRIHHVPNALSGGQKQRVAIARALANEPPIILADEPTGNLDSQSTREIMELFKSLHEAGRTVVIVTHEDEVAAYTKRTLWFKDGQLIKDERVGS